MMPSDLIFDLTTGKFRSQLLGFGIFSGFTDKNRLTVDWSASAPLSDNSLQGRFEFTLDN
jgi:hypothetical protein